MPIPKIRTALSGWQSPITLIKITQTNVDGDITDSETEITFQGVVQPLTPEALKIKPLEERSWEWLMIHTKTGAEISTNDLIGYNGKKYKVMFENDYVLNGYYEYHLVKNYE
jgi:hypothetical protein